MMPRSKAVLEDVRRTLDFEMSEAESPATPESQVIGDNSHLDGSAGVGGADNIQDANDAVDKFIADIVAQLVLSAGMEEDEAFDFVFDFLDSMDEKHLSTLPDDDADPEELALWLGKATTLGISAKILKTARGE
jgi:hypothetical protein